MQDNTQPVEDAVIKNESTSEETKSSRAALRSSYQNGVFSVGIFREETLQEDGSFTYDNALIYTDIDAAIKSMEDILVHARQVRDELLIRSGYEQAIKKLTDQATPNA